MAMAESATLRVQVSETASAGDLKAYLEDARCVVQVLDPHTLEVSIPRAPSRGPGIARADCLPRGMADGETRRGCTSSGLETSARRHCFRLLPGTEGDAS
jgi:hypothetical protein